jgi:hypothetical protein
MPEHFTTNLARLLERAELTRDEFIATFWPNPKDTRTPMSWFTRGKIPKETYLKSLAKFFNGRLGCRMPFELLKEDADKFESQLAEMLADHDRAAVSLPSEPDKLLEGHRSYLCGTYLLYRRCLVHESPTFNCDVVTIDKRDDAHALNIVMYCLPAGNAAHVEKATMHEHEQFAGHLWKFGNLFMAMTVYTDGGTADRRVHTLQFQWLPSRPKVHHAIVGGFSANLDQPFAVRAVLIKQSETDTSTKLRQDDMVRPLQPDDEAVKRYQRLLSNDLNPGHFVLTVDSRLTITN